MDILEQMESYIRRGHRRMTKSELITDAIMTYFVMDDGEVMNDYPLVAWHKIRDAIVTISSTLSEEEFMRFNFEDWLASQEDVKLERAVANSPYLRNRAMDYIRSKQNEKIVQQLCEGC